MSVIEQTPYQQSLGNGVTTLFSFNFLALIKTDLSVYVAGVLKVVDVDYTVGGLGVVTGGSVLFSVAPGNGIAVDIIRTMARTRSTDYQNLGDFNADVVDLDFDRAILLAQDLYTQIGRSIRTPANEVATLPTLPSIANRVGKYISFDANGQPIASVGTGNDTAFRTDVANSGAGTDGSLLMGFRRAEAGAVAMSVHAVLNGWLTPEMFGAVGNAVTDDTAAWQATIDAATTLAHKTILAQDREYYCASGLTLHEGIAIVGPGAQGSSQTKGFCFLHGGTGNFLTWDGNGAAFQGSGGGLQNCLIVKKDTITGGYAINLLATDDNHRPGEMLFKNVLIYALGSGQWARALNIDGTACNTPGAKGVRDVGLFKFRVGGCSDNNKYINISQGVHVHGAYIEVDQASGTGTPGITIDGDSSGICWSAIELNGTIVVDGTSSNVNFQGHASGLDQNYASCVGSFHGSIANAPTNASKNFRISAATADAFFAYRTTAAANVTGDGTAYTVVYDAEKFDKAASFDPATGIFTAKCAGLYQFNAGVVYSGLGAAHTTAIMDLIHRDAGATLISEVETNVNPGAIRTAGNIGSQGLSAQFDLLEGDTVRIIVTVSGSTKTVNVTSGSTVWNTWFTGKLLA